MKLILWWIVLLGTYVQQSVSEMVQCFSQFSVSTGKCSGLLGQVEKADCCLNPNYGYTDGKGVCNFCGRPTWSEWTRWSECSVSCTEGVTQRRRACYGNDVCSDSAQLGSIQTKPCEKMPCCPVQGGWTEWGSWQACSVTCEKGIKKRQRTCSNPKPECGGSCSGQAEEITPCSTETICPTHGGWSTWGNWGPCPSTCIEEGRNTKKELRKRTCTNPTPSVVPPGKDCEGSDTDSRPCSGLPFCPIDGNWGQWSGSSPCSVTCGVGHQIRKRMCDSPKPTHGGRPCHGDAQKNDICIIKVNCPVHGRWTEWSGWSECKHPSKTIVCRNRDGSRRKLRSCESEHNGNACEGEIVQHGDCYNIQGCKMNGVLSEWSEWSLCSPDCGPDSKQTREKTCVPDISEYSSKDRSLFSGIAKFTCEQNNEKETKECKNLPACKE